MSLTQVRRLEAHGSYAGFEPKVSSLLSSQHPQVQGGWWVCTSSPPCWDHLPDPHSHDRAGPGRGWCPLIPGLCTCPGVSSRQRPTEPPPARWEGAVLHLASVLGLGNGRSDLRPLAKSPGQSAAGPRSPQTLSEPISHLQ